MSEQVLRRARSSMFTNRRRWLAVGAAAGCVAALAAAPGANAATQQFTAVADTYSSSVDPSVNFGGYSTLKVDGSALRVGYLRFDPQGLPSPVTKATLRVYTRTSNATGFSVRPVASTTWDERTLTHNNRPAVSSTVLSTTGAFSSGTHRSLDVTAAVNGNGPVSLAIVTSTSEDILLASRETGSATAPTLIVETSDTAVEATPSPAPTTSPAPAPAPAAAPACTLYASPTASSTASGSTPTTATSLRSARDKTVPGSVVCLLPGTYDVASEVSISRSGEGGKPIVFRSEGGRALLRWTGGSPTAGTSYAVLKLASSAHHVEFAGLTIDGATKASQGVKCSRGAHHLVVRDSVIRNTGSSGVATKACDYVTVLRNLIHHTGYDPNVGWSSGVSLNSHVWFDGGDGFHSYVVGNVISGSSDESSYNTDGSGVIIDLGGNAPPVLVANNVAFENGDHCVQVLDVASVWVVNNSCFKNGLDTRQSGTGEITLNRAGTVNARVMNNVAHAWTSRRPFQQVNGASATYSRNVQSGGLESTVPGSVLGDPQQLRRSSALFASPPLVDPSTPLQHMTALPPWDLGARLAPQSTGTLVDTAADPLTAPGVTRALRAGMERYVTRDVAGSPRPRGAGWDVGAYEAG